MRTASMVLGIIGGALAVLGGIMLIIFGSFFGSSDFMQFGLPGDFSSGMFSSMFSMIATMYTVMGILYLPGGIVGLTGGIIVKNKNMAGGILLIISAVLTLGSIPLILAAIFALVKEKPKAPEVAYPPLYPPYAPPYAPYPPYAPQTPPQAPTDSPAPGNPADGSPQS
ncbi:MAG: DUF4064 domain-containing protein [Bacillota bacterium]